MNGKLSEDIRAAKRQHMRDYRARNPEYVDRWRRRKALQAARRKYWLNKYKVAKGCCECGFNAHGAALDFDHINPDDKSFHIAQSLAGRSLKNIMAEVRKCRVICANCHRIHSHQQAQKRRKYGRPDSTYFQGNSRDEVSPRGRELS